VTSGLSKDDGLWLCDGFGYPRALLRRVFPGEREEDESVGVELSGQRGEDRRRVIEKHRLDPCCRGQVSLNDKVGLARRIPAVGVAPLLVLACGHLRPGCQERSDAAVAGSSSEAHQVPR